MFSKFQITNQRKGDRPNLSSRKALWFPDDDGVNNGIAGICIDHSGRTGEEEEVGGKREGKNEEQDGEEDNHEEDGEEDDQEEYGEEDGEEDGEEGEEGEEGDEEDGEKRGKAQLRAIKYGCDFVNKRANELFDNIQNRVRAMISQEKHDFLKQYYETLIERKLRELEELKEEYADVIESNVENLVLFESLCHDVPNVFDLNDYSSSSSSSSSMKIVKLNNLVGDEA